MAGIKFVDEVTHVPAEWAQVVNDVVFGVLGGNTTLEGVRASLGFGSMATQQADNVSISGGQINNTPIGLTDPAPARFDWALIDGTPIDLKHATNKEYVDALFRRSVAGDNGLVVLQASATVVANEYNVFSMDDVSKHKVVAVSFSVAGTNPGSAVKLNGIPVKKIDRANPTSMIALSASDIPREALFMPDLIESTWILLNPVSYMGGGGGGGGNVYQDAVGSEQDAPAEMCLPAYSGAASAGKAHLLNSQLRIIRSMGVQYLLPDATDVQFEGNSVSLTFNNSNYCRAGQNDVLLGGMNITSSNLDGWTSNVIIGGDTAEIAPASNNRADATSPAQYNTVLNSVNTYVRSNDYMSFSPKGNFVANVIGRGIEGGSITVTGESMVVMSLTNSSSDVSVGGSRSMFAANSVGTGGMEVNMFIDSLVVGNEGIITGGTQEQHQTMLVGNSGIAVGGNNLIGISNTDGQLHGTNNALINTRGSKVRPGTSGVVVIDSVGQNFYSNSMLALPQEGLGQDQAISIGRNMLITMHSVPAYNGLLLCGQPTYDSDLGHFINIDPLTASAYLPHMLSIQTPGGGRGVWAFDAQIIVYVIDADSGVTPQAGKGFRVFGVAKTDSGGGNLTLVESTVQPLGSELGMESLDIKVRVDTGSDASIQHLSFYIWDTYLDAAYRGYANATMTVTELNNVYVPV